MRIVVCHPGPHFSVHDVYTGWVEALRRLGAHVIEFNLQSRLSFYEHALFEIEPHIMRHALPKPQAIEMATNGLYATLYKTRPDVLIGVSGFFLTPELLDLVRSSRTKVVLIHTESPYEDDRQLALAPHADINLINDPANLVLYQQVSQARYVPHCWREGFHVPGPAHDNLICDLAFVGTGYPSRIGFLEAMDLDGLDVFLAGNWQGLPDGSPLRKYVAHEEDECLDNAQTVDVYRSQRVGLNMYRREFADGQNRGDGWAMGPREVEMAACGRFFLRDHRPEGDDILHMLPTFTDAQHASELLRYWLARPEKRAELGELARLAVTERTFAHQAAELLRLLDRQPVTA
jgi:spore maturation protein CgeB